MSHLFFADDSLVFFKATPEACAGVKSILAQFSRLSGEVINYSKSHIMFSPNYTPSRFKRFMRSIIGTPSEESLGKYLGCNIEVDGRSSRKFHPLVEKVERKVSSWHHLSLSHAGRVLFINNILSMLSLNILSVFLIPKIVADKLNSIFVRFLWANSRNSKPIFWKSRKITELPKGGGGLGIRNVHLFNKAILAKQAIRIHNSDQSLISQVFIAKYKSSPINIVLQNKKLGRVSWGFRGLCRAMQDCRDGFTKQIGNGADTSIEFDKWLREGPVAVRSGLNLSNMGIHKVKDLMKSPQKTWNSPLIWRCFSSESAIRILSTHVPNEDQQDRYVWSESKSGVPKVKDVYAFFLKSKGALNIPQEDRQFWNRLWASDLKPKWKFFMWRLLNKALPTSSNLLKRNIQVQEVCPILFWKEDGIKSPRTAEFTTTLWAIWLHRNNIVFRNEAVNPLAIVEIKTLLLKELEESSRIKERNSSLSPINAKIEGQEHNLLDNHHNDVCVILVDGAWKRRKQNHPRAGIGWSAHVNNNKIFEGNDVVFAISSLQTEAHAIMRGLREASTKGINRVHIYSDNKELVQALHKRQYPFEVASLAHDIHALSNKFISCKIHNMGREVVNPAHVLATAARLGKIVS
ncbi:uncharacterized protein LOC125492441 [Beta vulgaris subsp. vulgaris]|uniref:uncharacterized protein LOC125492441 n=1 Tax=Beta vulgaris subsp. vulgaris TaxID=3555 RepID=UPI0020373E0F|nr:uncharacterized protein LOC125492441 [Beta vulgaris subsp. vulgaris]